MSIFNNQNRYLFLEIFIFKFLPLILFFFFISLILYQNNDYINNDGIGYLVVADLIGNNQIEKAVNLNVDLFYPNLILKISRLLNTDLLSSAKFIAVIFYLLLFYSYSKILNLFIFDKFVNFISLISIVCFTQLFDKYLPMIIREPGFWAFSLMGIYMYFRFYLDGRLEFLFLTIILFMLASLFRLESIFFLGSILIFHIFNRIFLSNSLNSIKKQFNWKTFSFFILLCLIIFLLYFFKDLDIYFLRFGELVNRFKLFLTPLDLSTEDQWLFELLKDYPLLLKFSFYSLLIITKFILLIGLFNILIIYFSFKTNLIPKNISIMIFFIIMITLIPAYLNLLGVNVISSRYLVLSTFIIFVYQGLGIFYILKNSKTIFKFLLVFFVVVNILTSVFDSSKINEEKIVANWFLSNNVPMENIYVNNMKVRFYLNNYSFEETDYLEALNNNIYEFYVMKNSEKDYMDLNFVDITSSVNINLDEFKIFKRP